MKAEVWVNRWGDQVTFVGDSYIIYDKVDRLGTEVIGSNTDILNINMEEKKLSYYGFGFRPLNELDEDAYRLAVICENCKHINANTENKCMSCSNKVNCGIVESYDEHEKLNDNFEPVKLQHYE